MNLIEKPFDYVNQAPQIFPEMAQTDLYPFDAIITNATGAVTVPNPVTVPATHDFMLHGISGYYQPQVDPAAPNLDLSGIPLITALIQAQGTSTARIFQAPVNLAQIIGSFGQKEGEYFPLHYMFPASSVITVTFGVNAAAWIALAFGAPTKLVGVQLIGSIVGKGRKLAAN